MARVWEEGKMSDQEEFKEVDLGAETRNNETFLEDLIKVFALYKKHPAAKLVAKVLASYTAEDERFVFAKYIYDNFLDVYKPQEIEQSGTRIIPHQNRARKLEKKAGQLFNQTFDKLSPTPQMRMAQLIKELNTLSAPYVQSALDDTKKYFITTAIKLTQFLPSARNGISLGSNLTKFRFHFQPNHEATRQTQTIKPALVEIIEMLLDPVTNVNVGYKDLQQLVVQEIKKEFDYKDLLEELNAKLTAQLEVVNTLEEMQEPVDSHEEEDDAVTSEMNLSDRVKDLNINLSQKILIGYDYQYLYHISCFLHLITLKATDFKTLIASPAFKYIIKQAEEVWCGQSTDNQTKYSLLRTILIDLKTKTIGYDRLFDSDSDTIDYTTHKLSVISFLYQLLSTESIKIQLPKHDNWLQGYPPNNMLNKFPPTKNNFLKAIEVKRRGEIEIQTQGYDATEDKVGTATIISAKGPVKNKHYINKNSLQVFSDIVLEKGIKFIMALGSEKGGNAADFTDYFNQNISTDNYTIEPQITEDQGKQLTVKTLHPNENITTYEDTDECVIEPQTTEDTNESSITETIPEKKTEQVAQFIQIDVRDNATFKFSFASASYFVELVKQINLGKTILIHCASGVGRTGLMKLLIALSLELLQEENEVSEPIEKLLYAQLSPQEHNKIIDIICEKLFAFRETRYTLQSEAQQYAIVELLLQVFICVKEYDEAYFIDVSNQLFGNNYVATSWPGLFEAGRQQSQNPANYPQSRFVPVTKGSELKMAKDVSFEDPEFQNLGYGQSKT